MCWEGRERRGEREGGEARVSRWTESISSSGRGEAVPPTGLEVAMKKLDVLGRQELEVAGNLRTWNGTPVRKKIRGRLLLYSIAVCHETASKASKIKMLCTCVPLLPAVFAISGRVNRNRCSLVVAGDDPCRRQAIDALQVAPVGMQGAWKPRKTRETNEKNERAHKLTRRSTWQTRSPPCLSPWYSRCRKAPPAGCTGGLAWT